MYDLIIIGSGPAGLTAAIYATRCYTLKTLVIGELPGGQTAEAGMVDNFPGIQNIAGSDLSQKWVEHAKVYGARLIRVKVSRIEKIEGGFRVSAGDDAYQAKSLVIATGAGPRKLGVPGEDRLIGKGVSYCALCDAPLYKGKVVVMVGGGDSALDGSLELAEHAKKIYVINRSEQFRAKPEFIERAKNHPKIELILNTNVTQINGKDLVSGVSLDEPFEGRDQLPVGGVFIEIGNLPDPKLPRSLGIELDENSYVKVSEDMSTNIEGVFAAGDITTGSNNMKQIVTACAEGAIAAQSVYRYFGERKSRPGSLGGEGRESGSGTPELGSGTSSEPSSESRTLGNSSPGDSADNFTDSKKKLVIDKDLCIGCGLCSAIAENTFELGSNGKAQVKNPAGDSEEKVQEAIDSCPVSAISWS